MSHTAILLGQKLFSAMPLEEAGLVGGEEIHWSCKDRTEKEDVQVRRGLDPEELEKLGGIGSKEARRYG